MARIGDGFIRPVDLPRQRRLQPRYGAQQRGLARAIRAAQDQRRTGSNLKADPAQHRDAATGDGQIVDA